MLELWIVVGARWRQGGCRPISFRLSEMMVCTWKFQKPVSSPQQTHHQHPQFHLRPVKGRERIDISIYSSDHPSPRIWPRLNPIFSWLAWPRPQGLWTQAQGWTIQFRFKHNGLGLPLFGTSCLFCLLRATDCWANICYSRWCFKPLFAQQWG